MVVLRDGSSIRQRRTSARGAVLLYAGLDHRHHQVLHPIPRWVTRAEVDEQHDRAQHAGVLVDGFVVPVGERNGYHGSFSGKKHLSGQNVQVVADFDGRSS